MINQIPIIDVSAIYSGSECEKMELAEKINQAAVSTGVFYISGLDINVREVYEYSKLFHGMPIEYKERYAIGQNMRHAGYVPLSENGLYEDETYRRRYESFDISLDLDKSDLDCQSGNIFYGPINWPDIQGFRKTIYGYFQNMLEISKKTLNQKMLQNSGRVLDWLYKPGTNYSNVIY